MLGPLVDMTNLAAVNWNTLWARRGQGQEHMTYARSYTKGPSRAVMGFSPFYWRKTAVFS